MISKKKKGKTSFLTHSFNQIESSLVRSGCIRNGLENKMVLFTLVPSFNGPYFQSYISELITIQKCLEALLRSHFTSHKYLFYLTTVFKKTKPFHEGNTEKHRILVTFTHSFC